MSYREIQPFENGHISGGVLEPHVLELDLDSLVVVADVSEIK